MAAPFDLITEARRLIRFNTVTWNSNADCAVHIGSLLRQLGLEVSYQESRLGNTLFLNVAGLLGHGKNPLLLATHLDTVDPGQEKLWTKTGGDPWKLTLRGDTLYGLGVADTKLDLLCKLSALGQLKASAFKRPVILLGTFGEESGLRGAACFCQGEFPKPQMALVGEPSQLHVVTRHKGFAVADILFKSRGLYRPTQAEWVYEVAFKGEAAHSSTPALGTNALDESLEFLRRLKKQYPKVAVLSWEGGTGHNIIPAFATLRVSLGGTKATLRSSPGSQVRLKRLAPGWYPTFPWQDALWCVETFQGLIAPYEKLHDRAFEPAHLTWNLIWLKERKEGWCLSFDLRALPDQPAHRIMKAFEGKLWKQFGHPGASWQFHLERDNPALDLEKRSPLVKEVTLALRAAGLPVKQAVKSGCSEAGLYAKVGIPSVVIGPGRSKGNIHRPNESVSLRQLKQAIRFYQEFLKRTCF